MPLAPAPGDQRTQQRLDVDSIGLNSTPAPADLKTAGVDHKALDAARLKEPRQPERVIAYFVAERDHRQRTARLRPTVSGRGELRHQPFCVPACDWITARQNGLITISSTKSMAFNGKSNPSLGISCCGVAMIRARTSFSVS